MGAGANERLGLQGVIGRLVAAPGAAMNEEVERRLRPCGAENIELLVFAFAIGDALGAAENRAGPIAGGLAAGNDLGAIRCIGVLVIGVVEFLLVHIELDQRPFDLRGCVCGYCVHRFLVAAFRYCLYFAAIAVKKPWSLSASMRLVST
jgi:hypothetical protein